jgi:hypothetical protein
MNDYPRVIIYGIALRDIINDAFMYEWTCQSFASMAPFVPVKGYVLKMLSCPTAQREFLLDHYWYLYRDRTDFQNIFSAIAKDSLENLPLDHHYFRLSKDFLWRSQREGILWERWDVRKQEKLIEKTSHEHPEYLHRYYKSAQASFYRQGSEMTKALEMRYLEGLIQLCRWKGIKLVLVNMPLGSEIAGMIPQGLNEAFQGYLLDLSQRYGVDVINLYQDPLFHDDTLFKDGVHLGYRGANLCAERIVENLKSNYRPVLDAMVNHAEARKLLNPEIKQQREAAFQQ